MSSECTINGITPGCATCNNGYYEDNTGVLMDCKEIECDAPPNCANAARGSDCTPSSSSNPSGEGTTTCAPDGCDPGFYTNDIGQCETISCICPNGSAGATGTACTVTGTNPSGSDTISCVPGTCNSGYHEETGQDGNMVCTLNVCNCDSGPPATGAECDENGIEKCSSCNALGTYLDGSSGQCVSNSCTGCINGSGTDGSACPINDGPNCATCNNGNSPVGTDQPVKYIRISKLVDQKPPGSSTKLSFTELKLYDQLGTDITTPKIVLGQGGEQMSIISFNVTGGEVGESKESLATAQQNPGNYSVDTESDNIVHTDPYVLSSEPPNSVLITRVYVTNYGAIKQEYKIPENVGTFGGATSRSFFDAPNCPSGNELVPRPARRGEAVNNACKLSTLCNGITDWTSGNTVEKNINCGIEGWRHFDPFYRWLIGRTDIVEVL